MDDNSDRLFKRLLSLYLIHVDQWFLESSWSVGSPFARFGVYISQEESFFGGVVPLSDLQPQQLQLVHRKADSGEAILVLQQDGILFRVVLVRYLDVAEQIVPGRFLPIGVRVLGQDALTLFVNRRAILSVAGMMRT